MSAQGQDTVDRLSHIRGDVVSTGVSGLDAVLNGGYPRGGVAVIRGEAGSGKTIFALCFATALDGADDACVYVSFDEPPERLQCYAAEIGASTSITFLDMRQDPDENAAGHPDGLGGLIARIENAIKKTGARRLVLDAFGNLFDSYDNPNMIRRELERVFRWCREHEITVVATFAASMQDRPISILVDYMTDCLINLSHQVDNDLAVRKVRVVKRRGRGHATNTYPFLITEQGIAFMPVTDARLSAPSGDTVFSTGLETLDRMIGGGLRQGNAMMISGRSGSGKSLLALTMAHSVCAAGFSVQYVSFEEAGAQVLRGAQSIGLNLEEPMASGRLDLHFIRAVETGLEEHVIRLSHSVDTAQPDLLILDPVSSLADLGDSRAMKNAVLRFSGHIKSKGLSLVMTDLLSDESSNVSQLNVSSLVDTWVRLRHNESAGEFTRQLFVQKARGGATDNQLKEFLITGDGLKIEPFYLGSGKTLFGLKKKIQEAADQAAIERLRQDMDLHRQSIMQRQKIDAAQRQLRDADILHEISGLEGLIGERRAELEAAEKRRDQGEALHHG